MTYLPFEAIRPRIEDSLTKIRERNYHDTSTAYKISLPEYVQHPPAEWLAANNVKIQDHEPTEQHS